MKNMKNDRKELAYFTRRLCERGLTTSLGGNLSLRCKDGNFIVTASG
ncbi:MAG: fuculose phosphate aldolase, partial [Spirochaetaceae bacterium]